MKDPILTSLTLERETLNDLRRLAVGASKPGVPVSVNDLIEQAVDAYLVGADQKLAALYRADEKAEAARVEATHGGEAA